MNKYFKILLFALICVMTFTLTACGKKYTVIFNSDGGTVVESQEVKKGKTVTKPSNPTKEGYEFIAWFLDDAIYNFNDPVTKDITLIAKYNQAGVYYNVNYNGTTMASQRVLEGTTLNLPSDPTKTDSIFMGWYKDATFQTKAAFPITINNDTTLYAKFTSFAEAFAEARNNTIGDSITGYEYDYTTVANATYSALSLNGNTLGNTKYNSLSSTSLYDIKTNSGLLFNDGSKYQLKSGNILKHITLNENDVVKKVETEQVATNYKYDTSSFAKALFEYSDDQLKSIEKTSVPNEYKLKTSFNASSAISLVGNYLNHPVIEKLIGTLPETSVDTGMYVTFANGYIKTYRYEMNINVTNLQFSLVYTLTFKNQGVNPTISPREFSGLSISSTEINNTKAEILKYLNLFASQERSSYDYKVVTGVDYGLTTGEINATIQGSTNRKLVGSTVYFHNDIEIDTDFKNDDLYGTSDVADIHIKKSMLSNGDVYLIEKKVLVDKTYLQENYTSNRSDSYYLYDIFTLINNFSFIQKTIESSKTTYSMSGSVTDLAAILNWINSETNIDPLDNSTQNPKVFGEFVANTLEMEDFELIVTIENNQLVSIVLNANGNVNTSFAGSRDFTTSQNAVFDLSYELKVTTDALTYEPFETVNDAK